MKCFISQDGDGGLRVHADLPESDPVLVHIPPNELGRMIDLIVGGDAGEPDYAILAQCVTDQIVQVLGMGGSPFTEIDVRKAAYQAVAPGPTFDEPLRFKA